MGKGDFHRKVLENFLHSLPWISQISSMTSSMTIVHQLPMDHINLHTLDIKHFQVELELFPAAKLLHSGREHVNVFHTGKLIILGVRDMNSVTSLIDLVMSFINK
jgi:TATA-box binding protein (TBP) (component of TFIID and TFIIIB)